MAEWRERKLGELIKIKHGFAFKGEHFSDRPGSGPVLVTPGNFAVGGGFKKAKPKFYTGEFPQEYVLGEGDLIVTMTDLSKTVDTLGYGALVPGDAVYLHNQRIGLVQFLEPSGVNKRFLCYAMRTSAYRHHVIAGATGSTVKHTSPSRICEYSITLPPLQEQEGIAGVLGALDDKIAVNERIATLALELADAQYARAVRELDFGPETFGSAAAVVGGGTPSTKKEGYWGGGIAWTTPTDVTALSAPYLFETSRTITDKGLENCASQLYPAQSIFMTSRATIGAFALPQMPAAVNQGFIVVLPPTEELRWWLLHEMRSRVDEMISLANGSTFLELSRKNFKGMPIRLASDQSTAEFAQAVSPLHGKAAQATAESRTLVTLRDTLLPQLMSGKLRVRDAEKIVEDAV
ncbi:restriction endonuclease subunit S [Streptomyces triticisoli]|uniref:restriction endonuclease subunit S n=1 Tax=Streptomyces triticisoli TaxID=2182797 RepID=UPI001300331C|nr:restriction endonuclease subunit S [Streptomyces triticisoli]